MSEDFKKLQIKHENIHNAIVDHIHEWLDDMEQWGSNAILQAISDRIADGRLKMNRRQFNKLHTAMSDWLKSEPS